MASPKREMLSSRCSCCCCSSLQAPQNRFEQRRGPEGRLHRLLETHCESFPPSLLQDSRAPNPQVLRCLILLTTESALRRLLSSDKRAPAAEGCVMAPPEEGEIYTFLSRQLTSSSSSGRSPLTVVRPLPWVPHPAGLAEVPYHVPNGRLPSQNTGN